MANINDYLRWRGDLSFAERPFNDVDNIILATLSYLDFSGIVPDERSESGVPLALACQLLLAISGGKLGPYVRSLAKIDNDFLELLADSQRFGQATLRGYVDLIDESRALQFCALQVDLPDGSCYVSFRGTDNTLVGWREDFMLSFTVTDAQREAASYLERAVLRASEQGRGVRVGGHSKGGNLAEYASVCLPDELCQQLVCVYSNDGPGMAPEIVSPDGRQVLGERLRRIVPSYSVVGMLFAREDDPRMVVASTGMGIGQHDPTTWQVTRSGIEEAPGLQADCVVLNQAIASWSAEIALDERNAVVNEVFDALGAGGATRFDEIAQSAEGLQQVLRALGNINERMRDMALALVDHTIDESIGVARKTARNTLEAWRRGARDMAADAVRKLQGAIGEVGAPE